MSVLIKKCYLFAMTVKRVDTNYVEHFKPVNYVYDVSMLS